MTIEEMHGVLKGLGIKKAFKPQWENETGAIIIQTKKPATTNGGDLVGTSIALQAGYRKEGLFNVWTNQKKRANTYAKANKLKITLFDGEAELWIPADKADQLLPVFGAKIKRHLSEAQKAVLQKLAGYQNKKVKAPAETITSQQ